MTGFMPTREKAIEELAATTARSKSCGFESQPQIGWVTLNTVAWRSRKARAFRHNRPRGIAMYGSQIIKSGNIPSEEIHD